ncbi:aromatic prenyltransferase [Aspergillus coremiiformis]|uniref:Aromatic prenyltransferase n=1 Tax=Aspergillus coremiiformis TaxID=138285 RepID=A0A5N6ZGI6_9EURO|nr:aromatic prenyltransferase [Aspergillus coremiiformis]
MEQISTQASLTEAWTALAPFLPPRDAHCDYWWRLTGLHLASLITAAGYPLEKQYQVLLFHYHWIVPYLGPAPSVDGTCKWRFIFTVDGSPIEYSWKWNTATSRPDIRYTVEAIGQCTGTSLDPLNQQASLKMLHDIQSAIPSVDLTWTNHFLATLYDHDRSKYVQEAKAGAHFTTTVVVAAEWLPKGLTTKTYFIPRKLGQTGGQMPIALWEDALASMDPVNSARAAMHDFLNNHPEGKQLSTFMLAVDNVAPVDSRLKFYFQTPRTSFSSVRDIMTLGGRIAVAEDKLTDLKFLIAAITGLDADFPEDAEIPHLGEFNPVAKDNFVELPILLSGYLYYFDIKPGATLPAIKIYSPVRRYGPDDLSIAHGICSWMEAHGRGQYCQSYLSMLKNISQHRPLSQGKGIQTYVSCLFKKNGELDITSYIGPEAFVPARLVKTARAVRRRSNS